MSLTNLIFLVIDQMMSLRSLILLVIDQPRNSFKPRKELSAECGSGRAGPGPGVWEYFLNLEDIRPMNSQ